MAAYLSAPVDRGERHKTGAAYIEFREKKVGAARSAIGIVDLLIRNLAKPACSLEF